ncbi:hypothetical protein [Muricoccus radiodurans]|uniref:hypothetical protein n=1 Tax=Muricoccus radiodurans TaxID=2231721 RepID=UPI003CF4977C
MSIRTSFRTALMAAAVAALPTLAMAAGDGAGVPTGARYAYGAAGAVSAAPAFETDGGEGADFVGTSRTQLSRAPIPAAPAFEANQGEGANPVVNTFTGNPTLAQNAGQGGVL